MGRHKKNAWVIPVIIGAVVLVAVVAVLIWVTPSTTTSSAVAALGKPTPPPPGPVPPSTSDNRTVVIVGGGVAGLNLAYRLAPILKSRLTIVDNRNYLGGKVRSYFSSESTEQYPVATPTCAEQFRGGDAIMRCIAQELGAVNVKRSFGVGFLEATVAGEHATGWQCSATEPNAPATCAFGLPYETTAPNGPLSTGKWDDLPDPCNGAAYTECSYEDAYFAELLKPGNANTATTSESFKEYVCRIFGTCRVAEYLQSVGIIGYLFTDYSARYAIDYLNYDAVYPYGVISVPHAGPGASTLVKMAGYIKSQGVNIILGETVTTIDFNNATKVHTLKTNTGRTLTSTRLALTIPVPAIRNLKGSVATALKATPYIQYGETTRACTMNLFFEERWWEARVGVCRTGLCASLNFTTPANYQQGYYTYSYWNQNPHDPNGIGFAQFVGTPERQQGKLFRVFFEDEQCVEMAAKGTPAKIKTEVMRRIRATFTQDGTIPEPVDYTWHDEPNAYGYLRKGATYTPAELRTWARQPIAGEPLCIASENMEVLDSGWMEGAAKSAHSCMRGSVFSDLIGQTVNNWERCPAVTSSGPQRYLDAGNKNSGNDICLLLKNEYFGREIAGWPAVCGGPTEYDYPTLTQINSGSYAAPPTKWAGVVSSPVYDKGVGLALGRGRKNILS